MTKTMTIAAILIGFFAAPVAAHANNTSQTRPHVMSVHSTPAAALEAIIVTKTPTSQRKIRRVVEPVKSLIPANSGVYNATCGVKKPVRSTKSPYISSNMPVMSRSMVRTKIRYAAINKQCAVRTVSGA